MEQRRLLRDSLFNLSASVLTAVLGLIAVPLFVTRLPTVAYADWIVILATSKSVVLLDFGVGWTIVHLIAGEGRALTAETKQHLRAAATFISGLAALAGLAAFLAAWLQLGGLQGYRLPILVAGAVMAAMSHLNNYSMSVLWGRRRFDLAGLLIATEAGLQSGGVIVILLAGGDIVAAAVWEAAIVTLLALAKLTVAAIVCRDAAFRPTPRWPTAPMRLIRFGLASQISDGLSSLFWSLGVLVLGQVATPASVVAFSVAQKVPLALAGFVTRAAEVTMPAASGLVGRDTGAHATIAVSSARIAVALCVPVVVTIWFVAAPFMTLWVGGTDATTLVPAMRIAAVAVAAHSLGESARYFLWGSGRVGAIVLIQSIGATTLIVGAGALYMLADINTVSFTALQAIAVGAMSVALSILTAGRAGLSGRDYAIRVARGIPLAAFAAIAVGIGLTALWPEISWPALIAVAAGVTATFATLMIIFGLDPDETTALRRLVRQA